MDDGKYFETVSGFICLLRDVRDILVIDFLDELSCEEKDLSPLDLSVLKGEELLFALCCCDLTIGECSLLDSELVAVESYFCKENSDSLLDESTSLSCVPLGRDTWLDL